MNGIYEIKKQPLTMKQIITNDDSISYYNEQYNESYHSTSGAIEESFEKFAKPCQLMDGMHVLDICFGLGYNSLAALCLADVHIFALESDPLILKKINENPIFGNGKKDNKYDVRAITEKYEIIRKATLSGNYADENLSLKIILGDAAKTIRSLNEQFDAVFLDPFSPKKCPQLWTGEFFDSIFPLMKHPSVLTTYSCASAVRKNLLAAGFSVEDGPCIGRRSPATIARKL